LPAYRVHAQNITKKKSTHMHQIEHGPDYMEGKSLPLKFYLEDSTEALVGQLARYVDKFGAFQGEDLEVGPRLQSCSLNHSVFSTRTSR
jgi:hypothetical protein